MSHSRLETQNLLTGLNDFLYQIYFDLNDIKQKKLSYQIRSLEHRRPNDTNIASATDITSDGWQEESVMTIPLTSVPELNILLTGMAGGDIMKCDPKLLYTIAHGELNKSDYAMKNIKILVLKHVQNDKTYTIVIEKDWLPKTVHLNQYELRRKYASNVIDSSSIPHQTSIKVNDSQERTENTNESPDLRRTSAILKELQDTMKRLNHSESDSISRGESKDDIGGIVKQSIKQAQRQYDRLQQSTQLRHDQAAYDNLMNTFRGPQPLNVPQTDADYKQKFEDLSKLRQEAEDMLQDKTKSSAPDVHITISSDLSKGALPEVKHEQHLSLSTNPASKSEDVVIADRNIQSQVKEIVNKAQSARPGHMAEKTAEQLQNNSLNAKSPELAQEIVQSAAEQNSNDASSMMRRSKVSSDNPSSSSDTSSTKTLEGVTRPITGNEQTTDQMPTGKNSAEYRTASLERDHVSNHVGPLSWQDIVNRPSMLLTPEEHQAMRDNNLDSSSWRDLMQAEDEGIIKNMQLDEPVMNEKMDKKMKRDIAIANPIATRGRRQTHDRNYVQNNQTRKSSNKSQRKYKQ